MRQIGFIYLINNRVNGKVYIGKTESTIKERWYTHKWRANHLDRVKNPLVIDIAIAKYGENSFEVKELDFAFKKEDLLKAEANWIKFYNSTDPDKGYNINPMGQMFFSDDYESLWQIPVYSQKRMEKYFQWRESLIRNKIPELSQLEFEKDIKLLSGVQLEKKYGFNNNRRALLREIRRILHDQSIKTIRQAKQKVCGEVYDLKKHIPIEKENEFLHDFKLLKGIELEEKYKMTRRVIVRNCKEILQKQGFQSLDNLNSLEEIKMLLNGKVFSNPKKRISIALEGQFKRDIEMGLTRRQICKKYEIGSNVFYRELERILNIDKLSKLKRISAKATKRRIEYIKVNNREEFIKDLKILSGVDLQKKYNISDRRILIRETKRILNNPDLDSMTLIKKYIGGVFYDVNSIKKKIPKEKEIEFCQDVRMGLSRRALCLKYNFGTKVLYRELNRILNTNSLDEARKK